MKTNHEQREIRREKRVLEYRVDGAGRANETAAAKGRADPEALLGGVGPVLAVTWRAAPRLGEALRAHEALQPFMRELALAAPSHETEGGALQEGAEDQVSRVVGRVPPEDDSSLRGGDACE